MDESNPKTVNPAAAGGAVQRSPQVKDVTVHGYTFTVNMDLVDDVENVDLIDKIETSQNLKAIVEFLQRLLGQAEYDKLKAYYVQKDGRFKLSTLGDIYQAIFEQFDPKG